ncbi:MAG: DoxX family protein [Bacteroidota bacterium]
MLNKNEGLSNQVSGLRGLVKSVLATSLGVLFLVTGIAKVLEGDAFSQVIAGVTYLSPAVAKVLAIIVVAIEVICGTALILRYKIRFAAVTLCMLVGIFIWILSTLVFENRNLACNCFGVLDIRLSNHAELMLDLILFNMLAVVALLEKSRSTTKEFSTRRQKALITVAGSIVLYLEVSLVHSVYDHVRKYASIDMSQAFLFAREKSEAFASISDGNRLFFFLNFRDFNCPLCFDDFIALCDSIRTNLKGSDQGRAVALFRQDDIADPKNPFRLTRWAKANGITFPILIGPDSLFVRLSVKKSALAVTNNSGKTLFFSEIPIGSKHREDVLRYLIRSR